MKKHPNTYLKSSILFCIGLSISLISCTQTPPEQTNQIKEKVYAPTKMIQTPDGKLYSPDNYLIERSSNDKEVIVTGNKIDTIKSSK